MKPILISLFFSAVALAIPLDPKVPSFLSDLQTIPVDESSNPEIRIWNGAKSDPIPFMVSLQKPDGNGGWYHFCGATLITPNRILTAYHCLPKEVQQTRFRAVFGTTINQEPGKQIEFGPEAIKRDAYMVAGKLGDDSVYHVNDNLVIQLPESVNVDNTTVSTVCLASGQVSGEKYYSAGWGRYTCTRGSPYLRIAEAQPLDDETCKQEWREKSDFKTIKLYKQFCSAFKQADNSVTPIYSGDSGGPLIAVVNGNPVQIGINSFVAEENKCLNLNVPPICSKVSDHQAFIKTHAPEAKFC